MISLLARATLVAVHPRTSPPGEARDHGALNFFVDPWRGADVCPALWCPEVNPGVVLAAPSSGSDRRFEAALRARAVLVEAKTVAGRHLVLAGKRARHRLLITNPIGHAGYIVRADRAMPIALAALSAFHESPDDRQAIAARAALRPSTYQRHRLALLLSVLDRLGRPSGNPATIRQIACELVFPGRTFERAIDWKSSSHRRQTQRLVAEARRMMATGYRDLLRGRMRPDPPVNRRSQRDTADDAG